MRCRLAGGIAVKDGDEGGGSPGLHGAKRRKVGDTLVGADRASLTAWGP
jgi:hypothetical protein